MGFKQDVGEVKSAANAVASKYKWSAGILLIIAVVEAVIIVFKVIL